MALGKSGNKDKRTHWIVRLNDMRKVVMHPAKQQVLTWDELTELERYERFIREQDDETGTETAAE